MAWTKAISVGLLRAYIKSSPIFKLQSFRCRIESLAELSEVLICPCLITCDQLYGGM